SSPGLAMTPKTPLISVSVALAQPSEKVTGPESAAASAVVVVSVASAESSVAQPAVPRARVSAEAAATATRVYLRMGDVLGEVCSSGYAWACRVEEESHTHGWGAGRAPGQQVPGVRGGDPTPGDELVDDDEVGPRQKWGHPRGDPGQRAGQYRHHGQGEHD